MSSPVSGGMVAGASLGVAAVTAEIAILSTTDPFTSAWWVVLVMLWGCLVGVLLCIRVWVNAAVREDGQGSGE